jgi:hypothetical protein
MIDNLRFALEGGAKVLWVGLLLGAGLPLVFALGVRSLAVGTSGEDAEARPGPVGAVLATLCFVLVLAGVAVGITVIVAAGFGKVVSFEHVYPTLVPKG